jgi:hypothetical protein
VEIDPNLGLGLKLQNPKMVTWSSMFLLPDSLPDEDEDERRRFRYFERYLKNLDKIWCYNFMSKDKMSNRKNVKRQTSTDKIPKDKM